MNTLLKDIVHVALVGAGATAIMDLWLSLLGKFNVPSLDFALVGRWIGHVFRGQWTHDAIAKAAPVKGERAMGWSVHYGVGIAFAGVLAIVFGAGWMRSPTLLPALLVGVGTVLFPLFVMQPAMGAGIASSKTRAPLKNCLRSVVNHAVFGGGLYLAAAAIEGVTR